MLLAVDESLGRLVALLDSMGTLDRTMIILTSDHGYFYGEHGLDQERRLAYEETARIPLLVRYPPMARAGSAPTPMVQTTDFASTILEIAGINDTQARDGRSLVPLMVGEAPTSWRQSILLEYWTDIVFPRTLKMGYKAVRTEQYKYIHYTELEGMDELYDLRTDPFEVKNIIDTDQGRAALPPLREQLARLAGQTDGASAR
jgi:N-acetylglucosamine-6-sulfatase